MGTSSNDPKAVTRMDEAIGILIRTARKEIKLTQIDLAKKVGLTFQQIQKYEKGINRVSASRLAEIAIALEKPLEYFFNHEVFYGVENDVFGESLTPPRAMQSNEISRVILALNKIEDPALLKTAVEIVEKLAQHKCN
ncbi:MAG: hypothetical protein CMK04_10275 [Ponticaulis sp.]|nr:hypothetical protein [Ponticaulis sp.]